MFSVKFVYILALGEMNALCQLAEKWNHYKGHNWQNPVHDRVQELLIYS